MCRQLKARRHQAAQSQKEGKILVSLWEKPEGKPKGNSTKRPQILAWPAVKHTVFPCTVNRQSSITQLCRASSAAQTSLRKTGILLLNS